MLRIGKGVELWLWVSSANLRDFEHEDGKGFCEASCVTGAFSEAVCSATGYASKALALPARSTGDCKEFRDKRSL